MADELCEFVPGGFAGGAEVVEAALRGVVEGLEDGVGGGVGEEFGAGWGADLVADDVEGLALLCEAEDGFGEVVAAGGEDPAGAEDEPETASLLDGGVAVEFGAAVGVERAWVVGFGPGVGAGAVVNVVSGEVDEEGAEACGFAGECSWGVAVEGSGEGWFGLGFVNGSVSGGVNDDLGGDFADGGGDFFWVSEVAAEVAAIGAEGNELAEGCEGAGEFPTELAVFAEEEDFHGRGFWEGWVGGGMGLV